MGILCDSQIRELIGIEPFEDNIKRPGRLASRAAAAVTNHWAFDASIFMERNPGQYTRWPAERQQKVQP